MGSLSHRSKIDISIELILLGTSRGLPRAQNRWGFQRGEAVALPFGRPRGSNPVVDIT